MSPKYIFGIHDEGGQHLMADAPGTIVYTVNAADDAPIDFGALAARGFRALVRLNHSHHGHGTIPPDPALWGHFAQSCAAFVGDCRGVFDFTIGNEPNLRVEWGRDNPILPEQYAACYRQVYDTIKGLYPHVNVSPAAIGPWNVESGVEWVEYFRRMLDSISAPYIDFICLHTYSRGYSPSSVTDNSRMDAPHQNRHNGFRAYKDFLEAVPPALRGVPVDIKEYNGNESWPDQNTGSVQAAYAEIHRHNQIPGTQKIRSLCLFRWPRFDERWQFETKTGVHEDFRAAVARRYAAPAPAPVQPPPTPPQPPKPPAPPTPPPQPAQPLPVRLIDESFSQRVPQVDLSDGTPGKTHYRLVRAEYVPDAAQRFGPDRHILVDVLDRQGNRQLGKLVTFWWGSDRLIKPTDKPSGPYAVDYPIDRPGHSYGVHVAVVGATSDSAFGMGLGKLGSEHMGEHVSYYLVFRETLPDAPLVPRPQPTETGQTMYVNAPGSGLKVRAGPDVNYVEVGGLEHGAQVTVYEVTESEPHWARIEGGWVAMWLLSVTRPAPPVTPPPVVTEPVDPVQPPPSGIIDPLAGQAIIQIESGGQGFGPGNRLLIRFENHLFNRQTNNAHVQLFRHGDPPWTGHQWRRSTSEAWQTVHTGNQASEWMAFEFASGLNRNAALQSISMGAPQVLGSHFRRLGYATPEAMFRAFGDTRYGMAAQMLGFVNFFLSDARLFEAMRNKDFLTVATIYNGPGQAQHYANLMRQAYERLR